MMTQHAIMKFTKIKADEISRREAHIEHVTPNDYHLIQPKAKYHAIIARKITAAQCRTRENSVRLVEVLFTATPDFFLGKSPEKIQLYFQTALSFLKQYQREDTILSAVVHLDEQPPHMHVVFVPLTNDNRLCAKEIVGNKKKLFAWQNAFFQHMASYFPELERHTNCTLNRITDKPPSDTNPSPQT